MCIPPKTTNRFLAVETNSEVHTALGCRLNASERASRRNEGDAALPRLNHHAAKRSNGVDDRVENWSQLRPIGILAGDEVRGVAGDEVRIAESLHHQQPLRVPVDVVL